MIANQVNQEPDSIFTNMGETIRQPFSISIPGFCFPVFPIRGDSRQFAGKLLFDHHNLKLACRAVRVLTHLGSLV
jgi:hypothetical protein